MPKFDRDSGILEIGTVQKYIETVTKNAGLRCSFRKNIRAPMTSKNELLIPKLNGTITQKDLKKLRWFVLHESLHHTKGPRSFDVVHKAFGEGHDGKKLIEDPLFQIYNVIEDERIERAGAKDYKGDGIILDEGWQVVTDQTVPEIEKLLSAKEVTDGNMRMGALWHSTLKARSDWGPACIPQVASIEKNMRPELEKYIKKLENMDLTDNIRALPEDSSGSLDAFDLAKKVFEALFEKDPDEYLEQKRKEGQANLNAKGKKGKKKSDEEGEGEGKPSKGEGKAKEYGGENGEKASEPFGGKVDYKLFTHSDHDPTEHSPGGTGITLDYTKYLNDGRHHPAYDPCNDIKVRHYRTNKESHSGLIEHEHMYHWRQRNTISYVEDYRDRGGVRSKGFGNKIRQLLQIRSQAKYIGGQKKGRLHLKNIYRAGLPVESYNERVFRQRYENDTLDTCVSVLTDLSGSMDGPKLVHAIESSILLNESISRALRIPVEISGFTEYGSDTFVGIIKEFDQQISNEDVLKNFAKATCFMKANADGDAVLFTYDRIKDRPEKRKIMIVISDGQPAASRYGAIFEYTKNIINQIEWEKRVELYAIGIMDTTVKKLYSDCVIIRSEEELEAQLLTLIKRSVFKR